MVLRRLVTLGVAVTLGVEGEEIGFESTESILRNKGSECLQL
jgi:hypothetical protein